VKRRAFIAGLGSAAAWPVVAGAQRPALPLVGWLAPDEVREALTALKQGLAEAGFVEGRNFAFESRSADNQADRLPALAAELVRRRVAVIVTSGSAQGRAGRAV